MKRLAFGLLLLAADAPPKTLTPPPDRDPRATVRYAPDRYDDILWENEYTAQRIYGPALQAFEPPSGSGIDAWGKNVVWPFMQRQIATGEQHDFHGEGLDFYNVGGTRGAGGLGVWQDNKLWVSRNWSRFRILSDGPDVADFTVDYAPWPVDVGLNVRETRRFTLPLRTNFTRMVSTITADRPGMLTVGIGVARRPTGGEGHYTADRTHGRFIFWSPDEPGKGAIGVAVMVDPTMIAGVTQDADNHLILLRVRSGKPFIYYSGATWSGSLGPHDAASWTDYVQGQRPNFRVPR